MLEIQQDARSNHLSEEGHAPGLARVARSLDISFWKLSTTPWNFLRAHKVFTCAVG